MAHDEPVQAAEAEEVTEAVNAAAEDDDNEEYVHIEWTGYI